MNKSEITYSIVEHLTVLSARPSGYTKELNLVAWNGHDEKLDIRDWAPDHSKSMKGINKPHFTTAFTAFYRSFRSRSVSAWGSIPSLERRLTSLSR